MSEALKFSDVTLPGDNPVPSSIDPEEARRAKDRERKRRARQRAKEEQGPPPEPRVNPGQRSLEDEIDEITRGYADPDPKADRKAPEGGEEQGSQPPPRETVSWATGDLLIAAMDLLGPPLVGWAAARRGLTVNLDRLRYTEEEKRTMKPAADEAAKYIDANIHPVAAFMLVTIGTTLSKVPGAVTARQE